MDHIVAQKNVRTQAQSAQKSQAALAADADSVPPRPRHKRNRRAVIGPDGTLYRSLGEAAVATGLWPGSIGLLADMQRRGWRNATRSEIDALLGE